MSATTDELREEVRRRYAESARAVSESSHDCGCGSGACCTPEQSEAEVKFGELLYDAEQRGELPDAAVLASLGCGNPTAVAELREGETVLDLGSGGGIDVILSAKRVGPSGTAYGLDMTDEMLALAMQNARDADVANVHFLNGVIEQIPLPEEKRMSQPRRARVCSPGQRVRRTRTCPFCAVRSRSRSRSCYRRRAASLRRLATPDLERKAA